MHLYSIASLIKLLLGIGIIGITYTSINVYEDPMVGIGLSMLWLFIASRGASFYLFFGIQKWFRDLPYDRLIKDSYKLSLLFGIFILINALFLLLWYRSKFLGLVLLIGFIVLQIVLFADEKKSHNEFPNI
jgi:Ca2+/Na+ antiporter